MTEYTITTIEDINNLFNNGIISLQEKNDFVNKVGNYNDIVSGDYLMRQLERESSETMKKITLKIALGLLGMAIDK